MSKKFLCNSFFYYNQLVKPVIVIIVSSSLCASLSSSFINLTIPVSRSTEKYGPLMLYDSFFPSGSKPYGCMKVIKILLGVEILTEKLYLKFLI